MVSSKWSDNQNWLVNGQIVPNGPGAADDVKFDTVQNPQNANSTDDVPQVTNLIMTSNFTGTITMAQDLTVTGTSSSMANGFLSVNGHNFTIKRGGAFNWTAGTITEGSGVGGAVVVDSDQQNPPYFATVNITGTGDKTLVGVQFFKVYGQVNWDGAGSIVVGANAGIVIYNTGFFIASGGAGQVKGGGLFFAVDSGER